MVKRSIPECIGSGLLAVAVAFLCVFWAFRPLRVAAEDAPYPDNVVNFLLTDLVKPLGETVILEYTSLDPTTLKIAEAELAFGTHVAFSSLEDDLRNQGYSVSNNPTGDIVYSGRFWFDDGSQTTMQYGTLTLSNKSTDSFSRVRFRGGDLQCCAYTPPNHYLMNQNNSNSRVECNLRCASVNGLISYGWFVSGWDSSPLSTTFSYSYTASILNFYLNKSNSGIPTLSYTSPTWTKSGNSIFCTANYSIPTWLQLLNSSGDPYVFPSCASGDPQDIYDAVLADMVNTYGQEAVDDIWIPLDLDHIPPTMDGFTFPGNLPGVTFPDVEIPETTLPETLWNSLAFYFQTFDQVATETGAKSVLVIFLIIALLCVMLKI